MQVSAPLSDVRGRPSVFGDLISYQKDRKGLAVIADNVSKS